ncbi:TetR/AcrR family transcriptional regulator [Phenylobacterium sp.]|uniref:TetR/AcrR family transcriptional regulator n=1 Tax=Phenylobacterium sp. TaxID=1871053 RepID=UPI0027259E46|nr:TetR/AcrR family transcriptional regulator [Phenylobacterium sp.]MDO8800980.1 helix-turn-helix domain-containing protein [Phenylobacterium sp.]
MRISRDQAQQNHDKVVTTAARLFRERGFEGVAVGDLMKTAGFTHGGFYNHFNSKDDLSAQALDQAFRQMDDHRASVESLDDLLSQYLSEAARRAPGRACPAAALAGDVARQGEPVKRVFAEGFDRMVQSMAQRLPKGPEARAEAIALLSRMVGALALARAMPEGSDLGREVLAAALEACRKDAARA